MHQGESKAPNQSNFSTPPPVKKARNTLITPTFNTAYLDNEFKKSLSEAFLQNHDIQFDNGAKFLSKPFRHCIMPNFLEPSTFLDNLQDDLAQLTMTPMVNDLYQFSQSSQLINCDDAYVSEFKNFLINSCVPFLSNMTKFELTNVVDLTFSSYGHTDFLLCHDDLLKNRKIAFIYYLVSGWQQSDGGTLDLFNSENGEPTDIATSIIPQFNLFVFFEVSSLSFHQVSEILVNKQRISLNGWFNLSLIPEGESSTIARPIAFSPTTHDYPLSEWFNRYLFNSNIQEQIHESFEANSEIFLSDFLKPNKYLEIKNALIKSTKWEKVGPVNKKNYEHLVDLPKVVEECVDVLKSMSTCFLLSHLTGMNLHGLMLEYPCESLRNIAQDINRIFPSANKLYPTSKLPKVSCEVRKWNHGYYTVLHDGLRSADGIEATLYFNCDEWDTDAGGITYHIVDDSIQNVSVEPKSNAFAMVQTSNRTTTFVNYINCLSKNKEPFFDISIKYFE